MGLPTTENLKSLDYGYLGQPYCDIKAKSAIDLSSMNIAYKGQPFVSNETQSTIIIGPFPTFFRA